MNKIIGIIVAILILVGGIYLIAHKQNDADVSTNTDTTTGTDGKNSNTSGTIDSGNAESRVVFSVTDAAADMSFISEVNMKISKIDLHSKTNGWVTVSTTPKAYDLLMLKRNKKSVLLADTKAKVGVYDQVRLTVDSVSLKMTSGAVKTAKLPSNALTIDTTLAVAANSTSTANFDFLTSDSLHTTELGDYIFAPVVKTSTEGNVNLNIDTNNIVNIVTGREDSSGTVGMDIDGSVKANFKIDDRQKLQVGTDGMIKVSL